MILIVHQVDHMLEITKVKLPNTTIADPCSTKKETRQCRLNGKDVLKLNEDLGAKMRPLDSRTVFIDVKVSDSLIPLARVDFPLVFYDY